MASNFRHKDILKIARKEGKVTVDALADLYNVTVQTIRRDLSELAEMGRLERVHGGAVIPSGVINILYEKRRQLNKSGKKAIAIKCAQKIPNGASVFMNIGTTTEAVARELLDHENLLIVTNNLNIANILSTNKINEETIEELESILLSSDIGIEVTSELINKIRSIKFSDPKDSKKILKILGLMKI